MSSLNIKTITYGRGATVNRGNFNSERIDLSVTVEVDDQSPEEAYEKARRWVYSRIAEWMKGGDKDD